MVRIIERVSVMQLSIVNVCSLLAMHCIDGVVYSIATWECGCIDTGRYHDVLVRMLVEN
jgi:hypothetical protein